MMAGRDGVSVLGGGFVLVVEANVTGVWRGVGRGVAVGIVRGGLLAANSVRVCVRVGGRTTGFLTVTDEATLCPATASGCVAGGFVVTRRVRPVLRRVGGVTTLF